MGKYTWTDKQLELLRKHYPTCEHPRDLEPLIGKSYDAIKGTATRLRIARKVETRRTNTDTPKAIRFLKDNYLHLPVNVMALALNRSETYVKGAMKRHNLIQPLALRQKFAMESRIQPGNVPQNKGKKQTEFMSPEAIRRTKATRFKKGQKIYNEQFDGALSIRFDKKNRPYVFIRLAKGKWEYLQRYVWECTFGPIPPKHIVTFKDGETMNCTPENLKLIPMEENMRRNSASTNLTDGYVANCLAWRDKDAAAAVREIPELIELKRKTLTLKRKLHGKQN